MNKLWILSLMLVWIANATSKPKRQYVTIPYQGQSYELRSALSGSRVYFDHSNDELTYIYKGQEIVVGGQGCGDKLMVTDHKGRKIELAKELVDPAIKEVMSGFKDKPRVIGQLQNCSMWNRPLKDFCKMKGPVGGRPSAATTPELTENNSENLENGVPQGNAHEIDLRNGAVDASEQGSSTDEPRLDREISVSKYVVPVIAVLAIMAVAVTYRTKMAHMAMVVKKRVVAWWHRSMKQNEQIKIVRHHEVRN